MNELMNTLYEWLDATLFNMGAFAPVIASFLILIESILPVLPLFVFITINFLSFGNIIGFIISWVCTVIGCLISFFLVKRLSRKHFDKYLNRHKKVKNVINRIEKLSIKQITVILAIPFTPAFAVNIAAGLIKIDTKKYFLALLISKIFIVYFWGFVGTSLIDSLKNPYIIIKIVIMIITAYVLSSIISKIFKLK